MADRLFRLGHHAVIRSNHDDRDVRDTCTTCTHGGEGLVARGIKEEDAAITALHLACTEMLRDAAALTCGDRRLAQCVQQARLAVVNVTHHRDDRRTRLKLGADALLKENLLRRRWQRLYDLFRRSLRLFWLRLSNGEAEFRCDQRCGLAIYPLVHGCEDTAPDQRIDDVGRVHLQDLSELPHGH